MRSLLAFASIGMCAALFAQEQLPLVQVPEVEPSGDSLGLNDLSGGFNFQLTPELPPNVSIENSGGIEYSADSGLIRYNGSVTVTAEKGLALFADKAVVHTKEEFIILTGNVRILQNGSLTRAARALYHYKSEKLETSSLRAGFNPVFLQSDTLKSRRDKRGDLYYFGENAGVTTHDFANPNYWLRANEIRVYPDDRVTFKNLKVYAGDTPLFWLPYLSQPLDSNLGYHFLPGARSQWGVFLLNSYGILLGGDEESGTEPWLFSRWRFDLRSIRGVGVGLDLADTRKGNAENISGFKSYFTHDLDPQRSRTGLSREDISPNRYKLELKHREWLNQSDDESLRFDVNLTFLSDQHFLEDFESSTFRINPEPDNVLSLLKQTDHYLAGIQTRIPLNDFYQSDTRLPEVFLEVPRQPLFKTPLLYESFSSVGLFEERLGDLERDDLRDELDSLGALAPRRGEIEGLLDQTQFARFHTYHEISRPLDTFKGLSLTPRVGIGHTQYWITDGGDSDNFDRTHLSASLDASLKFSKHYSDWNNESWGLNEALHVIKPYANLSIVSTDPIDPSFDAVDRLTPTTRPRAINLGRFSAIDEIQDWRILRLGVENSILTKRNGGSHPWLTLDTYVDVFIEDPEFDRDISNLYNTLTWDPLPWVRLQGEAQIPISSDSASFTEINAHLNFMFHEDWEITTSYRQLSNHPILEDEVDAALRAYGRLSETWGLGFYQQWSLDDGTLELQEYSLFRDLGSWNVSVGAFIRDNRIRNEYGLILNFSLSELPSIGVPLSFN